MKNKTIALIVLSVLSMIAILGVASAAMILSPTSYSNTIQESHSKSFTFTINNTGADPITYLTSSVSSLVGSAGTISSSQVSVGTLPVSVSNGTTSSSISVSISIPADQAVGVYNGTVTIDGRDNVSNLSVGAKTIALSINVTSVISCGIYNNSHDNLRIKRIEFTNNGFSGADFGEDDEWFPLDEIQIEITVENNGEEKMNDVSLEWGLYSDSITENDGWVFEMDDEDEFDIKSDDEEVVTVTLDLTDADVDLEDLNDGTYTFYVRATGDDAEFNDETICTIDSETADIVVESDFVVLSEISASEIASCGIDFPVSAKVWNIGEDDQEGVYVNVYNKELKVDEDVEIGDVDAFSYENLDAMIKIPSNAASKTYGFVFTVYDENDDVYENSNDDESIFTVPIKIDCTGGSANVSKAVVSASLVSGGKAGEDLVVRSTITNLDTKPVTYTISATGYSDWADSADADASTFTLAAGESKPVLFTFEAKDDAEGENLFDLELYSDNVLISKQPVSVSLEKKGFSFPQMGGNNYIWLIVLVNIILVIAIIIVAVRVMGK